MCQWTLILKMGSLFQIPPTKPVRNAPSGEMTMTSYSVGYKTSLSRKPCIADKSYYGSLSGSHDRSFRIRHEKSPEAPRGGEKHDGVISGLQQNLAISETMHPWYKKMLLWNAIRKSGSHSRTFRISHEKVRAALPGGGLTMTSYSVDNKTSSRKPCMADKKLLWISIMKSWTLSNFYKKQQILIQN